MRLRTRIDREIIPVIDEIKAFVYEENDAILGRTDA